MLYLLFLDYTRLLALQWPMLCCNNALYIAGSSYVFGMVNQYMLAKIISIIFYYNEELGTDDYFLSHWPMTCL